VWADVRPGMKLFQQETFGPTINLVRVDGIDEAIATANAVDYGLSSAIYTMNRDWAYRFKDGIEAGMTSINNTTNGAEAHLPFGGVKGSGNGTRESGIWVLEAYTYWHAVNDDVSGRLQLAQMDTAYEPRAAGVRRRRRGPGHLLRRDLELDPVPAPADLPPRPGRASPRATSHEAAPPVLEAMANCALRFEHFVYASEEVALQLFVAQGTTRPCG
jgi:hypothetical protein